MSNLTQTCDLVQTLLAHAETSDVYRCATQNEFLARAGQGKLTKKQLAQWLSQDRLYCQALQRFIGGLISRVRLPIIELSTEEWEWRLLKMLAGCLEGMMTELQFFEQTAVDYGMELSPPLTQDGVFGLEDATRQYVERFDSFTARVVARDSHGDDDDATQLLKGLVLLYASEKVYLEAWTYALENQKPTDKADGSDDLDGGALRTKFIPNWTSSAFHEFVDEIGQVLDLYAYRYEHPGGGSQATRSATKVAMPEFTNCLEMEKGFWPVIK